MEKINYKISTADLLTNISNSDELIEGSPRIYKHDLILNCAYVYALEYYAKMSNEENSLIQERIVGLKKGISK